TASPPTETSTLSLHDALPIFRESWPGKTGPSTGGSCSPRCRRGRSRHPHRLDVHELAQAVRRQLAPIAGTLHAAEGQPRIGPDEDRKSTRLNSSHLVISYAVF